MKLHICDQKWMELRSQDKDLSNEPSPASELQDNPMKRKCNGGSNGVKNLTATDRNMILSSHAFFCKEYELHLGGIRPNFRAVAEKTADSCGVSLSAVNKLVGKANRF